MNKLDLVRQYLDSEKITGTKIFYGSCIESHSDAKDVDVCVITNQTVDEDFYHRYKKFLIANCKNKLNTYHNIWQILTIYAGKCGQVRCQSTLLESCSLRSS
ncbi:hypothetical protein LOB78_09525, partial [Lactobacillus delbrueckii subsp. lactis]|uniref:hypothetical protein n=1 Tax=Lactobacillus delbrueckii TaxID=1584 RepID=UPI001E30C997